MGPPLIAAEDLGVRAAGSRLTIRWLEWGRRSSRRKTPRTLLSPSLEPTSCFNGAAAHRGGRRARGAGSGAYPRRVGFNGAAAHRGGKRVELPQGNFSRRTTLQWGRRSSRRKTSIRRKRSAGAWGSGASMGPPLIAAEDPEEPPGVRIVGDDASMGPPLIAAEDGGGTTALGREPCRACFNGAAAHRGGRPGPVPVVIDGNQVASMGPPLIAAEDVARHAHRSRPDGGLQWGRRSSRRKTRGAR